MRFVAVLSFVVACNGGSSSPDSDGPGSGPSDPSHPGTGPDGTNPAGGPTWYQDVAPLLADRCGACHRVGGSAPFSIETYENASPWGEAIADAIESGSMPPFYAKSDELCDVPLPFVDDITLNDAEKKLVRDWVDAGTPEGDPTHAAPAELRPVPDLEYDEELQLQTPFEISGSDDIYECFRIPLPNNSRKYLTGLQIVPDNDVVVHHVLVWNDPNDNSAAQAGADGAYGCTGFPDIFPTEFIGGWAPGSMPVRNPEGTGTPIEAGASLVLNIHYHPTGASTEMDRTKIRLQWTDEEPEMYANWFMIDVPFGAQVQSDGNDSRFEIPPDVANHMETEIMTFSPLLFRSDATIFAVSPHMHFLGTDQLVNLLHDDGSPDQCLVHAPGFRFDFQRGYAYDASAGELPVIRRGDQIKIQCMYDNSESNPFLPQHLAASGQSQTHEVYWGEETGDEMCMVTVGVIVPKTGWGVLF